MSHWAKGWPVYDAERPSYAYERPLLAGERTVLPGSAAGSSLSVCSREAVTAGEVWHRLGLLTCGFGTSLSHTGLMERRGTGFTPTNPFGPNETHPAALPRRPCRRWARVTFCARACDSDRSSRSAHRRWAAEKPERPRSGPLGPRSAGRTSATSCSPPVGTRPGRG